MRLRVKIHDYEGHPRIPPGSVANVIGAPGRPEFLVVELDEPIEVEGRFTPVFVSTRYLAVSAIDWNLADLLIPPTEFNPHVVYVWHVFDPVVAESSVWPPGAATKVAKGQVTRIGADGQWFWRDFAEITEEGKWILKKATRPTNSPNDKEVVR